MRTLTHFWEALDTGWPAGTVPETWRHHLGKELDWTRPWFRPLGEVALAMPHYGAEEPDAWFDLHASEGEEFFGFCEATRKRRTFTREEVSLWGIDRSRLADRIADLFQLEPDAETVVESRYSQRIGWYHPLEGFRFPVIWCCSIHHECLETVLTRLGYWEESPFILLTPTYHGDTPLVRQIVKVRELSWLSLSDALLLDEMGQFQTTEAVPRTLQEFHQRHVPDLSGQSAQFPTPPGTDWPDVLFQFLDQHTLSIRVGETFGRYHYNQLGMQDARTLLPNKQWELLQTFARESGELTWSSPDAHRNQKKRKSRLSEHLQQFLRIPGDPFEQVSGGWRIRFRILPD